MSTKIKVFLLSMLLLLLCNIRLMAQRVGVPWDSSEGRVEWYYNGVSGSKVEFSFPFYDDNGNDRWIKSGIVAYSTDGGTNWTSLLTFETSSQSEATWYWIRLTKLVTDKVECLYSIRNSSGGELSQNSSKTVQFFRTDVSVTSYTRAYISWTPTITNVPIIFRVTGTLTGNDNNTSDRDVLHYTHRAASLSNTKAVVLGTPLSAPQFNGFDFSGGGYPTYRVAVPGYTAYKDKSTEGTSIIRVNISPTTSIGSSHYVNLTGSSEHTINPSERWLRNDFNQSHTVTVTTVRYDYNGSSTSRTSSSSTIPAYPCPSELTASAAEGKITLTWNMTAGTSSSIQDNYQIYWRRVGGTWQAINVTKTYSYSDTKPSVTFDYPEIDKGTNNYEFLVARSKFNYTDSRYNSISSAISIATDKMSITSINANLKDDGTIQITWANDGGRTSSAFRYRLYRKEAVSGAFYNMIKESVLSENKSYFDESVASCTPYIYEIRMFDGTTEYFSKATPAIVKPDDNIGSISDISVSKGFYNDRVNISWKVSSGAGFKRYSITRQLQNVPNTPEQQIIEIASTGLTQYSYDDNTAIPGTYYTYRVVAWTECNNEVNEGGSLASTGFIQPYGVVSGKISYGTGTAVPGVTLIAQGAEQFANKALFFNSNAKVSVQIPYKEGIMSPYNLTFQTWINNLDFSTNQFYFISKDRYYLMCNTDERLSFGIYSKTSDNPHIINFNTEITSGSYIHITVTCNVNEAEQTATAKLYFNGELKETITKDSSWELFSEGVGFKESVSATVLGGPDSGADYYMNGYMDEVRFWNKALSDEDIANNYDRYLSGKEEGLTAYYRFDEANGNDIFDISGRNGVFNENHGIIVFNEGVTVRTLDAPSAEKLAIKATTDSNGAYLINTIPYSGDGNIFTIVPSMGIHKFSPTDKPLYFSNNSTTHNNIDFTDISSFEVSGRVVYENTDYPVEGVSFYVDGNICTKDGEIIYSDGDGNYTISVPIGEHFIRVEKQGHTFINNGRYPANTLLKHNFQNPGTINFTDNTLVTIAGRVVGGEIEAGKQIGFGLSDATIGKATIQIQPLDNRYSLQIDDAKTYPAGNNFIETNISVVNSAESIRNILRIETDSENGEFVIQVPPVPMSVINVSTLSVTEKDQFKLDAVPNINPNPSLVYNDTCVDAVTNRVDSFPYHSKVAITYRVDKPTFKVKQSDCREGEFGERAITYFDKANVTTEEVELYTTTGDKVNYLLGHPVFLQLKIYKFEFEAFEEYVNADGIEHIYSKVPLAEAAVTVKNDLGKPVVAIDPAEADLIETEAEELKLDSLGKAVYQFAATFPNLTSPYTLGMNISYDNYGKTEQWDGNGSFEAYVFGSVPSGNNFVTSGPDLIQTILRDPPGSNSSAYMSEGTTITNSFSYTNIQTAGVDFTTTIKAGLHVETMTGIGVAVANTVESKFDTKIGVTTETTNSWQGGQITTTTINEQISTSSSPDYVGAGGDVFVGNATNLLFGMARDIGLRKDLQSENYIVDLEEIITTGVKFSTAFKYDQLHIENDLIPNYYLLRDNALITVTPEYYNYDYPNLSNNPIYITTLQKADPKFGSDNSNENIWGNEATSKDSIGGPSYLMILPGNDYEPEESYRNDIVWYNSQIRIWESLLAQNEEVKYLTIENRENNLEDNHSFSSGVTYEYSKLNCSEDNSTITHEFSMQAILGGKTGAQVNKVGFEFELEGKAGGGFNHETGESTENCTEYGYSLADEDTGDYFSVDVLNPTDGFGYIFRTRGGKSSCPYEGAEVAKYYRPNDNLELSAATMQREIPVIRVENPFATDIPSGKEATYTLLLSNESETGDDIWFLLRMDDETNPFGAALSIDGSVLTYGREILVKSGDLMNKTLKLKQTRSDILEYNDIRIILSSVCQTDEVADTVTISAQFTPTCSDVKLVIDDRTLNNNTSDTLKVRITDYNLSYENFKAIRLQYKYKTDQDWKLVEEFETALLSSENISTIRYDFLMSSVNDGTYQLRAVAVCDFGSGEVYNESETIEIIKDMKSAQLLGNALPANGILTPDDEVSVTFNEDIRGSYVTSSNVSVKAILNGHKIDHAVAAKFTGAAPASTEATISLANRSFSIEAWFKRNAGETGTLFAHANDFALGFNSDDKVVINISGETFTSVESVNAETWQYISFSYNAEEESFSVYSLEGSNTRTLFAAQKIAKEYVTTGYLYVGAKSDQTIAFTGSIHDLTLWSKARVLADLSDKDISKSGNEKSLIGYWTMTEGKGTVANDKARNRHIIMPTANYWYLNNENKAVEFNGINDYLTIPIATTPVSENESFVIEFWFKGNTQTNATLFSCGDGILDTDNSDKLLIGFNETGVLELKANGISNVITGKNYLDNSWHHIAVNVLRSGNTIVYIDEEAVKMLSGSAVGGITASEIALGARLYNEITDNYFDGSIDEVRIWKATMTADIIRQNINNRLTGNEDGLLVYCPFEETITNEYGQQEVVGVLDPASGSVSLSDNAPALKEARVLENVSHTFTVSDRKIVVNVTEQVDRIENCILEFNVKNILDLNNNNSQEIYWTAYVNINRLKWDGGDIFITKEYLAEEKFEVTISNQSGKAEYWMISNMPSWLSVSKQQGTLNPLSSEKLTFTIKASTAIGSYEETIYLTGNNNIDETLAVSLKVTAEKPDWTVNPKDFELSMNLIGQLRFEASTSEDEEDIVAAFINNVCVGVASPKYLNNYDTYFVTMDIFGNNDNVNQKVQFKAWDASTGQIYPVVLVSVGDISFGSNKLVGSMSDPVILDAQNMIEQQISLSKGWNWISINAESDDMTVNNVFSGVQANAVQLKAKTTFAATTGSLWSGSLDAVEIGKMYKVNMKSDAILSVTGEKVNANEQPISISSNWNWIGYVPQFSLSIEDALADLEAEEGDLIKGQTQFAVYGKNGWVGSLTTLAPGKGYLYQSKASEYKEFYYPSVNTVNKNLITLKNDIQTYWTPVDENTYSGNMTIIAQVKYGDNITMDCQIGVFAGSECRGAALSDQDGLLFVTVAGDETNSALTFKVRTADNEILDIDQSLKYTDDAMIGTIDNPYIIQLNPSKVNPVIADNIKVYPTKVDTYINVDSENIDLERVVISDMNGKVIMIENNVPGNHNEINLSTLVEGVYIVKVETVEGEIFIVKIVK